MKIIKHPVTLKDKFTERKLKIQKENSPFAHVQRGENEVFDLFMDQADSLSNTEKQLLEETELFNKTLLKDKKLLSLSEKINDVPRTKQQILQYHVLNMEKKY